MKNHEEYKRAIERDREYVFSQVELWELKAKEATEKLEYWNNQAAAMRSVESRVSLFDNSAFYSKQDR